jgi:hypothetical protein
LWQLASAVGNMSEMMINALSATSIDVDVANNPSFISNKLPSAHASSHKPADTSKHNKPA